LATRQQLTYIESPREQEKNTVYPSDSHSYSISFNMAPPSKLAVATGSVTRLVKEEASYHKELVQQEERIKKLEASEGDENKEYTLRQEVSFTSCGAKGCSDSIVETSPPRDPERVPSYSNKDRAGCREA
jgi:hypothetical protein